MRATSTTSLIALIPMVLGCGGSGSGDGADALVVLFDAPTDVLVDAPSVQYDFSCVDTPAPTTAAPTVTVAGEARGLEAEGFMPKFVPLTDATVNACVGDCMGADKLDTKMTPESGCIASCPFTTGPLTTGGVPLDGYLKLSKSGYRTSNVFPPSPLAADAMGIPAIAFSQVAFQTVITALGITQGAENGTVGLLVADCAATPIEGATVTVTQDGENVGTVFNAAVLGEMGRGASLVFNVPPGPTEVSASYNGMMLRTHTITTFPQQTSYTQVRPGIAP